MTEDKLKQLQDKAKERHANVSLDIPVCRPELFEEKVARIKAVAERVNKAIGLCEDCGKQDCQCGFGE